MRRHSWAWLTALLAALGGSYAIGTNNTPPAKTVTSTAGCHANGDLPDPACTPGATNPQVTQATINQTICVRGWTATVRPPVSVTQPIKTQVEIAYGIPTPHPHPFAQEELDHAAPLELGGALSDVKNLWPEPAPAYHLKDALENRLKAEVCSGKTSLADAQHEILTDWVAAARKRGLPTP